MSHRGYITGMEGVYLVAAKLSHEGFIVSPTSRSAVGADLLVTNLDCTRTFSVQVKTNAKPSEYFLVGKHARTLQADSLIYVLVNLGPKEIEYFVVPSKVVAALVESKQRPRSVWHFVRRQSVKNYQNGWRCFGKPNRLLDLAEDVAVATEDNSNADANDVIGLGAN